MKLKDCYIHKIKSKENRRVENYDHLKDTIHNDGTLEEMGKLIILPSSFTGSPQYMQQRTQDAMVYVRKFGTPDFFITFTCNNKCTKKFPKDFLKFTQAREDGYPKCRLRRFEDGGEEFTIKKQVIIDNRLFPIVHYYLKYLKPILI